MEVVGEFSIGATISSGPKVVRTATVPASALLPFVGRELTITLAALFAQTTITALADDVIGGLAGSIDGYDDINGIVFGWCAYKGMSEESVSLEILVDNEPVGTVKADLQRTDLVGLYGKGFHGFHYRLPERFRDGIRHSVEIRDALTKLPLPKSPLAIVIKSQAVVRPSLLPSLDALISPINSVNSSKTRLVSPSSAKVTIVILTRDGAEILNDCLASIWRHAPSELVKVVIVDHHSSDHTAEVVKSWQSRLTVVYDHVLGNNSFSFANNHAIQRHADTEYVLLLNNDIILIEDVVGKMLKYLEEHPDVGLVGCKLMEARDRRDLSKLEVHHLGIQIEMTGTGSVDAFETASSQFIADQVAELQTYSVTGACVMMRTAEYLAVGGLEQSYFYGGEDVELGEAVWCDLGKKVVCLNNVTALHHRGWLRLSSRGSGSITRVQHNSRILKDRVGYQMRKRYQRSLVDPTVRWSGSRATIGFVVVEAGPAARTGEFFTANELGAALAAETKIGVEFLEPSVDWYDVRGITHIVNMLHEFKISQITKARPDILKVAWLRNNFEEWVASGDLHEYHQIWCSSELFCEHLRRVHGLSAVHVPIATNIADLSSGSAREEYLHPVIFNGSHSGVNRSFVDAFAESSEWENKLAIYGHGWERVPSVATLWKGFIPYSEMRDLYASSKIVIDHAHVSACRWGGTNSRIFDAIAAGCLPLSNSEQSARSDFDGLLPVWHDANDLKNTISHYLEHEEERLSLVNDLRQIVEARHQYRHRATQVSSCLVQASDKIGSVAIKIGAPNAAESHMWGDTHLAEALAAKLRQKGLRVAVHTMDHWESPGERFDASLVMRGLSRYQTKHDELSVAWVISHPHAISTEELKGYDGVAFASEHMIETSGNLDVPVLEARQFASNDSKGSVRELSEADVTLLEQVSADDVIFIGNTRRVRREFILAIAERMPVKVIGEGWDQYLPMEMVLGSFVENRMLPYLYAKAFAVLNDHWQDMNEAGILSNRVVDVLSSGGLVLSDWNDAGAELLSPELFFRTPSDAIEALQRFREQPEFRHTVLEEARRNVQNRFSAEVTADRIFELLETAHKRRMSGIRRHAKTPSEEQGQKRTVIAKSFAA